MATPTAQTVQRRSLKGIELVSVSVTVNLDEVISRDTLQTLVDLRLRQSGIRVLDKGLSTTQFGEAVGDKRLGTLNLAVYLVPIESTNLLGHAYIVRLQFSQTALIGDTVGSIAALEGVNSRDTEVGDLRLFQGAVTWQSMTTGVTSVASEVGKTIRKVVSDRIDEFSSDYVTVNPQ